MIAVVLSLALSQAVATSNVAQQLDEAEAAARIYDLHMAGAPPIRPFATVSALGSWREPNEVLSLFVYRPSETATAVVVRKLDLTTGAESVASSQRCRGLKEAVTGLELLNLPEIDVPLLGDHETGLLRPTVKDGVSYTLWMPYPGFSDEQTAYDLELRFTSASSFERWYQRLVEVAESCWHPAPRA